MAERTDSDGDLSGNSSDSQEPPRLLTPAEAVQPTSLAEQTDSDSDLSGNSSDSQEPPRLLTPAEAAQLTGLSRKQITGKMDRGALRVIRDATGTRRVPKAELVRAGLLTASHPVESPSESGGELVIWRDLYERERRERADAEADRAELRAQLAAIANAGPIRALRLRRLARRQLALDAAARDTSPSTSEGRDAPA
ncbi:MAG: hypothetical protein JOZ95_14850 [Solirubrobacterales bacterium]|nr:hypothetical protein [Solirubrobacterales bacterium]